MSNMMLLEFFEDPKTNKEYVMIPESSQLIFKKDSLVKDVERLKNYLIELPMIDALRYEFEETMPDEL